MPIYSYSRLSTFEQCSLKFKLRYIDKIVPKIEKSIEAHLGGVVHSTLEWIYSQVQEGNTPNIENTIDFYSKKWQEEYKEETLFIDKSLTQEHYFNKGVGFVIDYHTSNHPFDDNTIEIEKKILINIGEHKIQGFIDRLSYNLETNEYEIHDYKTSNSIPPKEKLEKDKQLALYCIAIKEEFGAEKEVKLIWHFLAYKKKFEVKKTNEQLEELKKEILNLIKKIESTKEFQANKSPLCKWCEYRDICPAWKSPDVDKYPTLKKYIKE